MKTLPYVLFVVGVASFLTSLIMFAGALILRVQTGMWVEEIGVRIEKAEQDALAMQVACNAAVYPFDELSNLNK